MKRELSILRNYVLYILIGITIALIGISNVFAVSINGVDYTAIGYMTNKSTVMIEPNYTTSQPLTMQPNQSYYTQIKELYINIDNYSFSANVNYQVEFEIINSAIKLTNANAYKVIGANGELCSISYSMSNFTGDYPRWNFSCSNPTTSIAITIFNSSNTAITSTGNFQWGYTHLWYTNTPITSTNNENNSIIENNNENTDRIIDNQNQNTQDIINSQKVCSFIDKANVSILGKSLNYQTGAVSDRASGGITDYIRISSNDTITRVSNLNYGDNFGVCYYNVNKTYISCEQATSTENYSIPSNASYVRFSLNVNSNLPQYKICKNGNSAVSDSINNLDDTLNNDDTSDATNEASDFFSDFNTNTFGLTSIITAPLNLIQSLTSKTCSQLELPLPYLDNKKLILPCMTDIYSEYFGTFFTMYQTITYGIIAYWVCVRIFNLVKDFKNPEHDEIEVVDL